MILQNLLREVLPMAGSTFGRRQALTLVELLIVIGIIAILMGLLLPAVQMAREAARRTSCGSQMRQLGLAAANYESAKGRFPAGYTGPTAPRRFNTWITTLLPYLEQSAVYDQMVADYAATPDPFANPSAHRGFGHTLPLLICPSSTSGWEPATDLTGYPAVAFTTYFGVNGQDFTTRDGIFYLDSKTRTAEIRDGLSNTIMIGERPPSTDRWFGWWYAGYGQLGTSSLDSLMGAHERNIGSRGNSICGGGPFSFRPGHSEFQCSSLHYWSQHPGGAQFVFADGSVKFLAYESADILPALASRTGGEVVAMP
jgi:prepilin-type processing-associated H-X9-DG protein